MKIQIVSDLHREFGSQPIAFDQAELIIMAGDVDVGVKGAQWMLAELPQVPILYVLGNHEYYHGSYPGTLEEIRTACEGTRISLLEDLAVEVGEITFHGTTLWTDFNLFGKPTEHGKLCEELLNDYHLVSSDSSSSKLRSTDTLRLHQASRRWLEHSLQNTATDKNVVITHHGPSIQSIAERYLHDPLSAAFASPLDELILKTRPDFWIHGHTHSCFRYQVGETEVICNPHGYIHEPYNGFDPDLFIEL
ncbi:MAG: metallophosphoesterase [Bacteroidota bacterium]